MLAAKSSPIDLPAPQPPPQQALGAAHGFAQGAGVLVGHGVQRSGSARDKTPPPRRAERVSASRRRSVVSVGASRRR